MIKSELLKDKGVLVVSPVGRLEASDFEHLAAEIDPYIQHNGRLHGLMVYTEFFPSWADFARDKPQAAPTARARVPKRGAGAEPPVVATKAL